MFDPSAICYWQQSWAWNRSLPTSACAPFSALCFTVQTPCSSSPTKWQSFLTKENYVLWLCSMLVLICKFTSQNYIFPPTYFFQRNFPYTVLIKTIDNVVFWIYFFGLDDSEFFLITLQWNKNNNLRSWYSICGLNADIKEWAVLISLKTTIMMQFPFTKLKKMTNSSFYWFIEDEIIFVFQEEK